MKAKIFTYVTAMILFGALMAPFPPTAQEQVNNRAPAPSRYTVEVLQGLGGLAGAFSINDTGLASGTSEPPGDPFDRALVWRDAQPTDLGTLGGHNSSVAYPNKNDNGWRGFRRQLTATLIRRTFASSFARRSPATAFPLIRPAGDSSGKARRTN